MLLSSLAGLAGPSLTIFPALKPWAIVSEAQPNPYESLAQGPLRHYPRSVETPDTLGIIAGNGVYPRLLADAARRAGVKRIVAAAFTDETDDLSLIHI